MKDLQYVTAVYRNYRCTECGYRHNDGVYVNVVEYGTDGDYANGKPVVGRWCCDSCGEESWVDDIKLSKLDMKECEMAWDYSWS